MTVRPEQNHKRAVLFETLWACLCALLLYLGLWGSLSSMAYLSARGFLPLLAGGPAALAVCCCAKRRRLLLPLSGFLLLAAALLFFLRMEACIDGAKLLLNRLFQASERVQPYLYDKFPVAASDLSPIDASLLPLGLLSGLLLGWIAGKRLRAAAAAIAALLLLWMAWLGLYPRPVWLLLLFAGAALPLLSLRTLNLPRLLFLMLTAAALLAVSILCFPAEDPALRAWSAQARDALAPQTVFYSDQLPPAPVPETALPQNGRDYQHTPQQTPDVPAPELRPLWIGLLLLGLALLLFVPSVLADRLRKRRAKARAGLDDPDNAACIRASFLYAMRHLELAGLPAANQPYSAYAAPVRADFPTLSDLYAAVLPLWQEAAYSDHPMTDAQRAQMRQFLEQAKAAASSRMKLRARLRCRLTL